jgi:hypothetical protein
MGDFNRDVGGFIRVELKPTSSLLIQLLGMMGLNNLIELKETPSKFRVGDNIVK